MAHTEAFGEGILEIWGYQKCRKPYETHFSAFRRDLGGRCLGRDHPSSPAVEAA